MANYLDFFENHSVRLDHRRFPSAVSELKQLVDSKALEERLQQHLTEHPYILSEQFGHCHHVFAKIRLGGKFEADFFCLDIPSPGKRWIGVEIESPDVPVITKAGRKSAKLEHALQQIRDWRSWIRENLSTARNVPQSGGAGLEDIDPNFFGWVIIGRRATFTDKFNELRNQVEHDEHISIRSWDGILDWANKRASHWYQHIKAFETKASKS